LNAHNIAWESDLYLRNLKYVILSAKSQVVNGIKYYLNIEYPDQRLFCDFEVIHKSWINQYILISNNCQYDDSLLSKVSITIKPTTKVPDNNVDSEINTHVQSIPPTTKSPVKNVDSEINTHVQSIPPTTKLPVKNVDSEPYQTEVYVTAASLIDGGIGKIDIRNPEVIAAALNAHNIAWESDLHLRNLKYVILSAKSQIVSGIKYYLNIEYTDERLFCDFEVIYVSWINQYSLISNKCHYEDSLDSKVSI
jgi:uncharacterized membrane protein